MWCSWSKCWFSSTGTTLPTKRLNTMYATSSPSCVFSDDNWNTGCADSACRSMHEEKLAADNMPSQIAIRVRGGIPRRLRRREPTGSNPMCGHWLSIPLALRRKNGVAYHVHHRPGAGAAENRDDEPGLQYEAFGTTDRARCPSGRLVSQTCLDNPLWHKTGEIKLERSVWALSQRGNQVTS